MSEIILKTNELIDTLNSSDLIKKLIKSKNNCLNDDKLLGLIKKYNSEVDTYKKLEIKKKLYKFDSYKDYLDSYNELSMIVFRINQQYKLYTNTKEIDNKE